jgi:hypothetical protein
MVTVTAKDDPRVSGGEAALRIRDQPVILVGGGSVERQDAQRCERARAAAPEGDGDGAADREDGG